MSAENREQDEISRIESEDKLRLRRDAESLSDDLPPTDTHENEPTRRFAASAREQEQTVLQNAPDTEPTEIFSDRKIENGTNERDDAPDENALCPSRLRLALVVLMLVLTAGWTLLSFGLLSGERVERDWRLFLAKNADDNYFVVQTTTTATADKLRIGDELLSVNGTKFTRENFAEIENRLEAGDRYTLGVRRGGQLAAVELVAQPVSWLQIANRYVMALFIPVVFLLVGGAVFLLKPNDKAALLFVIGFCLVSIRISAHPNYLVVADRLPSLLVFIYYAVEAAGFAGITVVFHFYLIFPARLRGLRRFPAFEYLLYLPCLIFILLPFTLLQLSQLGWLPTAANRARAYLAMSNVGFGIYALAGLTALLFNYFQANEMNRRRIRLLAVALAVNALPVITISAILLPLGLYPGGWIVFFSKISIFFFPFVFAYAIVRHKVIPVSLVIRRGLQYLLAKNALRLLLILPVVGILWNITANPNRTLNEILFQNSFWFYFFVALAVVDGILMRSRLSVWIDKKFFREQYNQEKLLRDLIDDVKQSDSMPKMSRLVSSRIQSAIHPQSVYLFYEDRHDDGSSDFSTGYTKSEPPAVAGGLARQQNPPATAGGSDLKLAADSPILRFMQTRRGAVDFPFSGDADLPAREINWLRSIGANLLVPMHGTDGKLAGFFSLGEKMSEIPYTSRDKELLETLANQIALVNENLSLKDRVRREQKIKTEVLSRFDAGQINLLKECPRCGKCFDRDDEKCDREGAELTFSLPVERTIENRYRLERLLGKGGMGAVYEATDLRINRAVAVKILSGAMFGNRDALRRFEREAQTAGKLNHRNIVTVFDYGVLSTEGAFLVMELVKGNTLSEVLRQKGKLDAATVVIWFAQVLNGLETAHKAGIIHRDLKPDNIFVTRSEDETVRLCILDFGLARFNEYEFADSLSLPGTIMGTLGYMPPEQLRGERTDERSDLFATGVIIYESLHGEKPYAGKTYQEIMRSMSKEIIFGKDEQFAEFFRRSLALKQEKRFASANEMKTDLLNST